MLDLMSFLNGGGHRIKLKKHEYIRVGLIVFVILLLIVSFVFEIKYFSNTFDSKKMVIGSLFVGVLLGAVFSYKVTTNKPEMETLLKFQIWVALIICTALVMPFFASLTNRYLSFRGTEKVPVVFVVANDYYADRYGLLDSAEPDGCFVFILKDGKLERLKTKKNPFPEAMEDDTVLLPVRKGFWGFEYVVLFVMI